MWRVLMEEGGGRGGGGNGGGEAAVAGSTVVVVVVMVVVDELAGDAAVCFVMHCLGEITWSKLNTYMQSLCGAVAKVVVPP